MSIDSTFIKKKLINKEKNLYLLLVVVIYCGIYLPVVLSGKMYIYLDIGADTYSSYWPVYAFTHDFFRFGSLSGWSFQQGLGANIVSLIPWMFDPYNIFIFPFSKHSIDLGIFLAATARVFSLAFLAFLYMKRLGFIGVPLILSSLAYTFSGFFVGWGQHYQFATTFVLFTFIMLGLEIWLQTSKKVYFILSVALLAAYWPYTLYMSLIFLPIYYVFRYTILFRFNFRAFLLHGLTTAGMILIGIALAGVSFFPSFYNLINAPRVSGGIFPEFSLASVKEYLTIFVRLLSNGLLGVSYYHGFKNYYESPFLYTGILTFFMLPGLFLHNIKKIKYTLPFVFITLLIFFPPITNPIFGALSTYTYRWTFVLVPVFAIALGLGVSTVENNIHPWIYLVSTILGLIACVVGLIVNHPSEPFVQYLNPLVSVIIVFVFSTTYGMFLYFSKTTETFKSYILLTLFVCEITLTGYVTVNLRGLIDVSYKDQTPFFDASTNKALELISTRDNSFYRINKHFDYIYLTDALFQGFYGEKQYSSVISSHVWELQELFHLRGPKSNYLYGFDSVQSLRDLSAVRYMLARQKHNYPGYQFFEDVGEVYIYKNLNALPLGTIFYKGISLSDFKELSLPERQYILYDAVIFSDPSAASFLENVSHPRIEEENPILVSPNIEFEDISVSNNEFPDQLIFTSTGLAPSLKVELLAPVKSSLGISFSLDSSASTLGRLYFKTSGSDFNEDDCLLFSIDMGRHNYYLTVPVFNVEALRMDVSGANGSFTLDNFIVQSRDDEKISIQSNELASSRADIEFLSSDYIKATANLDEKGIVYFAIPFDEGWQVYVDGKVSDKYLVNIAFTGVPLENGQHRIELKYIVPWLQEGVIISVITLSLLLIYSVIKIVVKRSNKSPLK